MSTSGLVSDSRLKPTLQRSCAEVTHLCPSFLLLDNQIALFSFAKLMDLTGIQRSGAEADT